MANFLDIGTDAQRFASVLADYERRLQALERSTQAGYTSIEGGGSLDIYDEEGTLKGSVGVQPDGGVALVPVNTAPPPTPTAPAVEPVLAGLLIGWDGQWDDAYNSPSDFSLIQVHVGTASDFVPDVATQVAAITAPLGGTVTIAIEGYDPVWVRLVGQNTGALTGPPSPAVQAAPRQAVEQDLIDGMVTEKKLAEAAVTEAKIALGAVGSTALASGAVLEDKLAKAAVTLGKIADGAVHMNALGGALADGVTQRWIDAMADPAQWQVLNQPAGATWEHLTGITDAPTGHSVARATGYAVVRGLVQVPYDPDALYRISARARTTSPSASGTDTLYVGALGIAADGATLVSRSGANSYSSAHYVAASNTPQPVAGGWTTYVGYLRGRAAPEGLGTGGQALDARAPGVMHGNVRFLSPILYLNYGSGASGTSGVMEIDAFTIEVLKTGVVDSTNLVVGSVTTAALAADSVTAGKVAADAIGARELQANSITANELMAGSVTTDKLTVAGGLNLLPDPSFEGANTALLTAGNPFWAQVSGGNGSAYALRVTCTAATATSRNLRLTTVPILAGEQLYLAVDYMVSTDWVGRDVRFFARWFDGSGAQLSTTSVTQVPATAGAWGQRSSGTVTAPAGTVQAQLWVEANQSTAGTVLFDNAVARPLVPGVQIADGAITAPKILAGAITTDKLVGLSVTAEKIASLAITTDKLSALSVTADKLAVNSVTATKIAAGVIDATHIKAGAIDAERLALGVDGNLVADPSFEGETSVARAAVSPFFSIDAPGYDSPKCFRIDCTSATKVSRVVVLGRVPAVSGTKVFVSLDYKTSADWDGTNVAIYVRWEDVTGGFLGYSVIYSNDPGPANTGGAWRRISGVPADGAPAQAVRGTLSATSNTASVGTVWIDNAIIRPILSNGSSGARAELSPLGLQLFDGSGEEAVALMTGRPNYLTLAADGVPVATIDQEGKAGFQALAIAEGLTIGGDDLSVILDQRSRGIIAYGVPTATVTSTGTEIGFFELPAQIEAGRMYRIYFQAIADFDSANDGEGRFNLRDGGTARPSISSTLRHAVVRTPSHSGRYWTAELEHIVPGSSLGAGLHRFLISFWNEGGSAGQTMELGLSATGRSNFFIVEDIGPELPRTGGPNTGGGTSEPPLVQYKKTYSATWSGSYAGRGSYNSYHGNSCYQGYYSSTNGMQASLIGFSSALASDLAGATIQKAEVYLYFDHWHNNSGGKAVIRAHAHASRPGSFSSDSEAKTISWAKNQGQWVDITSVFDSTKWRGIALDPNASGLTYYGRARGYGQTNAPKLRVTYTK
ncbi:hypothetical protein [Streptomyces microflavus]|uniref:hypothetical protein n=1 Tax=Streptomyces microflavus TaxID=1919 RepID=UPI00340CA8CE